MKKQKWMAFVALALAACNGPWNMQTESGDEPAKIWVSCLLVADKPLDTLWMERPFSLSVAKTGAEAFVDTSASSVVIVDEDAGVTFALHAVPGKPSAWVSSDTAYRVRKGGHYRLAATLRWNAAVDFPQGADWKTENLAAEARVPGSYALKNEVMVPIEALHPSLSVGLPKPVIEKALKEEGYRQQLFDSLKALPGSRLSANGITLLDFEAYLKGTATYHAVPEGDTLWYVFDEAQATDYSGESVHRYSLPFLFGQVIDKSDFGGVILSEHFDSTRARIYDPLQKGIDDAFNQDLDSVEFFQGGNVRGMIVGGSYFPDLKNYPDTLRLTNLLWGYTGRNVMYAHSVDPLYFEYYKGLIATGGENDGGPGGGSSRPQNVLRYSNVENGDGYFTGAALDSFAFELKAVRDTIPVSLLRAAWEKSRNK